MLKLISSRIFWGIFLVLGGAILLLDTIGVIEGSELFWIIAAFIGGVLFLSAYFTNKEYWWALIPGTILLSLAIAIGLDSYLPGFKNASLAGPVILAGIALSFLLVYVVDKSNWWAIIPFGVMATLVVVAIIDLYVSTGGTAGIFFLGLGLTFGLVALLPNSVAKMKWAWFPAAILGVMGFLILIAAENLINYIWPIILILVGIYLVVRSFRSK
jgi:hypothetical protein